MPIVEELQRRLPLGIEGDDEEMGSSEAETNEETGKLYICSVV